MREWLAAQGGELPTLPLMAVLAVVMLLDTIPLVGVAVPGDVAVLTAIGVSQPASGLWVFTAVIGGCVSGWSMGFLAGRRLAVGLRDSRVGGWIGETRWVAAERMLEGTGGRIVLVAPFLPVFNTLLPLAAGALRMSYGRFLTRSFVGTSLWAGLYVLLGVLSRTLGNLLPADLPVVGTLATGLLLGGSVLLVIRRRLKAANLVS